MKSSLTLIAAVTALVATPVLADSPDLGSIEPVVSQAASVPSLGSPNWTGVYGGVQLGFASVDTNVSGSNEDIIGGLVAGYDFDLGDWVVGGGLDYDFADISVANGAADLESVFRVKLRGGYKVGSGLLYGTGGYALADTDNLGSDDGYFIGGGYEHLVSDNFSIGGEVLYHDFNNYSSSTVDVDATTVQIRGTFRF